MPETHILIADDHPLMRQGLRQIIETATEFKVVAEAGDGQMALEMIQRLKPEIAVLDIRMPVMDGFAVAREVNKQGLAVKLIFLTAHLDVLLFEEALALDVKAYVSKESAVADVLSAIRAVLVGQNYTSPLLTTHLLNRHKSAAEARRQTSDLSSLTPTERQVLQMIADYKTSKEIAEILCISPHTVDTHRRNICERLDLRGSHALMRFALNNKHNLV